VVSDDPAVIDILVQYLRIAPIGYGFWGVTQLSNTTPNARRRPWHASSIWLVYIFVLYIPLALLGSSLIGLTGIFYAGVIAAFGGGTVAFFLLRRMIMKECDTACRESGE